MFKKIENYCLAKYIPHKKANVSLVQYNMSMKRNLIPTQKEPEKAPYARSSCHTEGYHDNQYE